MSLRTYEKKRNFAVTSEPRPHKSQNSDPIFVVQLHHARVRHYDFRLQVGNALKSWAVPKGPSFNPTVKRLAVEVEDHPVDYGKFEGDIPEGQYGAGHVDIFDHGTWSTDADPRSQLKKGHLEFQLHGDRLRGAWHLVRTRREAKQPQWMLFKGKDEYAGDADADDIATEMTKSAKPSRKSVARPAAKNGGKTKARKVTAVSSDDGPAWDEVALAIEGATKRKMADGPFEPQLARSREAAPTGDDWLHETKWDGYRILVTVVEGRVRIWSRNALDWTARLPTVVSAIKNLSLKSAQIDGELIVDKADPQGFNELQAVLAGESKSPLVYAAFDIVHINGVSLANCSLLNRKTLLQSLLQTHSSPQLLYSDHHIGDGELVFDAAVKRDLEGIMSKRVDSVYRGGRGNDWVKVKSVLSDEFVVVGYTKGRGSRSGFGALLLARPGKHGGWEYAGRMGSGFSETFLNRFGKLLAALHRDDPPVTKTSLVERDTGHPLWVEPKYVVEVYYRGMGKEGLLRQPSLKTLREDKAASDLVNDPDSPIPVRKSSVTRSVAKRKAAKSKHPRLSVKTPARSAQATLPAANGNYVSHPGRVVFPQDGYTKQQVAEYYEYVMPWLLPQIASRPLSLVRCPGGTKKACFFQKHHTAQIGPHVLPLALKDSHGAKMNFLYVDSADGIRDLIQMNVLEFHPWGSTVDALDSADLLIFDLDPGPRVSWKKVITAAELVRKLLEGVGLESFVKLSGGKGLHVAVPLNPVQPWVVAKQFCRHVAALLAQEQPKEFIDVATKSQRSGRIFVDYLRNTRGATSVAAYSLRARPGAPMAMPLEWSQLRKVDSPAEYTLRNAPPYLRKRKDDPWQDLQKIKQSLPSITDK